MVNRITQTLGKYAVFVHINGGTDKFMHVAVVTNPQINGLLSPADNSVEFGL